MRDRFYSIASFNEPYDPAGCSDEIERRGVNYNQAPIRFTPIEYQRSAPRRQQG
jgi:hypothetical protein